MLLGEAPRLMVTIVSISGGVVRHASGRYRGHRRWLEQSEVYVADINLTQEDADVLLAMEKHKADDTAYEYPSLGGGIRVPLLSPDKRESFFLDITRSQIKLTKGTYQNRARGVAILARLDFGGAPHRNPDDKRSRALTASLPRGLWRSMAMPLPDERFSEAGDPWLLLLEFMQFVNVTLPPDIRRGLLT